MAVHAGHCLGGVAAGRRQDRDARRGACPASPRDLSARDGERSRAAPQLSTCRPGNEGAASGTRGYVGRRAAGDVGVRNSCGASTCSTRRASWSSPYMVGPRVSEILHLHAGCVRRLVGDAAGAPVSVIVGSIFKRQPGYDGCPHEWVAPPVAVQAISVLEALSEPHRALTARRNCELRRRRGNGAWSGTRCSPNCWRSRRSARVSHLLRRFGACARPDAPRQALEADDASGAQDLRQVCRAARPQLPLRAGSASWSPRARAQTDHGYVGSDYRLNQEIDAEILNQSVAAWEHMLAAPGLGGRAAPRSSPSARAFGAKPHEAGPQELRPPARRRRTRARRVRLGLLRLPRGTQRLPRQRDRAQSGRREPSTCARCQNFVVSAQHRPYWLEQVRRSERARRTRPAAADVAHRPRALNEARWPARALDADTPRRHHAWEDAASAEPPAAQRLHDALAEMVRQHGAGLSPPELTAKALCESAGISRNALYRYHRDVLLALHDAQPPPRSARGCERVAASCAGRIANCANTSPSWPRWSTTTSRPGKRRGCSSNGAIGELADRRIHRPQVIPLQRSPGNRS